MSIDQKLDEIIRNQTIIMQMLTDLIESVPDPAQRPNVLKALAPLLDSPMIKNNPALAEMVKGFTENIGGQ